MPGDMSTREQARYMHELERILGIWQIAHVNEVFPAEGQWSPSSCVDPQLIHKLKKLAEACPALSVAKEGLTWARTQRLQSVTDEPAAWMRDERVMRRDCESALEMVGEWKWALEAQKDGMGRGDGANTTSDGKARLETEMAAEISGNIVDALKSARESFLRSLRLINLQAHAGLSNRPHEQQAKADLKRVEVSVLAANKWCLEDLARVRRRHGLLSEDHFELEGAD